MESARTKPSARRPPVAATEMALKVGTSKLKTILTSH